MTQVKEIQNISHKELQETRLYRIAAFVVISMFLAHGAFIGLFWYLGIEEMAYLNLFFSMPMIFICFYFVQRKWILQLAFVSFTEILVHAMFAIYYIGWESGFYFYLITAVVITQSYPWKIIAKFFMFIIFSSIIVFFYLYFHTPVYDLENNIVNGLYLMNLFVFSGLLAYYMWYQVNLSMNFEKQLDSANVDLQENNDLILNQKNEIEEAHQEIKDSISYAKRIQSAILPPDSLIKESIPNSFILFIG
jgi:hypothetical protein